MAASQVPGLSAIAASPAGSGHTRSSDCCSAETMAEPGGFRGDRRFLSELSIPLFLAEGAVAVLEGLPAPAFVGRKGGNSRKSGGKEAQEYEEV